MLPKLIKGNTLRQIKFLKLSNFGKFLKNMLNMSASHSPIHLKKVKTCKAEVGFKIRRVHVGFIKAAF
jgi:hypothetical protein